MLASLFRLTHGSKLKALEGIPGPTPRSPFGTALEFVGKNPWDVCADYAQRYGGMTLIWMGGTPALVLNDPQLIGEVLDGNGQQYWKDAPGKALAPVITNECMFTTNGEQWAFMRQNSPLSAPWIGDWFAGTVPVLHTFLRESFRKLAATGDTLDLLEPFRHFCYDAFSRVVWGQTFDDTSFRQLITLATTANRRMTSVLPLFPPISPAFYRARRDWYGNFAALVQKAQTTRDDRADDLLHATLRNGTKLSDRQLMIALTVPIYFGGVFPIASVLMTTLFLLAQHPELLAEVQAEARECLRGKDTLDLAALDSCKLVDWSLREAMRLRSPVPLYFRNVLRERPTTLGGRPIPANTLLLITNRALHRAADHWPEPGRFDPRRWGNGVAEANPLGSGYYFPFGRGPRTCIGQPFSMLYLRVALVTLLTACRVEIDPTQPYKEGYFFAVTMPQGLKGRFLTTSQSEVVPGSTGATQS